MKEGKVDDVIGFEEVDYEDLLSCLELDSISEDKEIALLAAPVDVRWSYFCSKFNYRSSLFTSGCNDFL